MKGITDYLALRLGVSFEYVPSNEPFLHPGQSADVLFNGKKIGFIGALHPDVMEALELRAPVLVGEVDLEHLKKVERKITYAPISRYPETTRDLSFVVSKGVSYRDVLSLVKENAPSELSSVRLIDVYEGPSVGEGKVSMTLSFTFVSKEKTLSDEEVDEMFWRIADLIEERLGAKIRGKKD